MEYEVRFYYSKDELNNLLNMLEGQKELHKGARTFEKTMQYNHCDSRYDFYTEDIDGRFRVRVSTNELEKKCMLSWKRRSKGELKNSVNKEEEIEVMIEPDGIDNFLYMLEKVIFFEKVESYERYRTTFTNDEIEISIDEYPFGIALEIENKSKEKDPEEVVTTWVTKLGLEIKNKYDLSWDDKYTELCKEQNIPIYREVTFDKEMPSIK